MTPEQLADSLERNPYIPVRIHLKSGDAIVLHKVGLAIVLADKFVAMVPQHPFDPPEKRRMRVVPLANVQAVEDLPVNA